MSTALKIAASWLLVERAEKLLKQALDDLAQFDSEKGWKYYDLMMPIHKRILDTLARFEKIRGKKS